MGGIADHRLVQVADLHVHPAIGVGDGAEVAQVAIAADPHGRTLGAEAAALDSASQA